MYCSTFSRQYPILISSGILGWVKLLMNLSEFPLRPTPESYYFVVSDPLLSQGCSYFFWCSQGQLTTSYNSVWIVKFLTQIHFDFYCEEHFEDIFGMSSAVRLHEQISVSCFLRVRGVALEDKNCVNVDKMGREKKEDICIWKFVYIVKREIICMKINIYWIALLFRFFWHINICGLFNANPSS